MSAGNVSYFLFTLRLSNSSGSYSNWKINGHRWNVKIKILYVCVCFESVDKNIIVDFVDTIFCRKVFFRIVSVRHSKVDYFETTVECVYSERSIAFEIALVIQGIKEKQKKKKRECNLDRCWG